ncbi:MAG TPA: GMC family oxidoreductase [Gemmatimonadaceae bacterium]|jgi:choline dehydrogenase|nr:GMC family oxidoreductase [Gemmatimonadaceae bacterium]
MSPESIRANQQRHTANLLPHYDYIVCGAGSAGSVVAGQLAANPDVHVLLLEAGGTDDVEAVLDPNQWPSALGTDLAWGFTAAPNPHLNGRAIPYSMGKVLGGGGSINVGIWSRGHQADWDFFADAAGDPAWGHPAVLNVYRRIEDRRGCSDSAHDGAPGSMWVQPAQHPHPLFAAALDSMRAQGIRRFDTMNGQLWEEPNGCAYVDEIVRNGRRQSPFRSYVYPRMAQPNLTVLTGATVTHIHVQGRRAIGVSFWRNGNSTRVDAALEIVLSLGALQTPKVLMQSGIGDEAKLKPFGITVVTHLPDVGRHLHDHVAIGCVWEAPGIDIPTAPRGQAVCFWKTDPAMLAPNALAFATAANSEAFRRPAAGWSLFAGLTPEGRGELHLTGPNASDPLRIETNFMSEPRDLKTALDVVAMCRSIGNGEALRPFVKREVVPGNRGRADMEQFVRNGIGTFWHQSGTARMGRAGTSVVDGTLRVHGIDGLRIADASIMPRVTVGNTMAPSVVIGQRAADILNAEHGS